MKRDKIIFWISTGLLTALMLMSCGMYLFNTAEVMKVFETLGYPTYIVIPLAIAKLLGLAAIWLVPNRSLKDWAYAGFFYDLVLAFFAHLAISDGGAAPAAGAIVLLMISYFFGKRVAGNTETT